MRAYFCDISNSTNGLNGISLHSVGFEIFKKL